jgi:hypothetical protein
MFPRSLLGYNAGPAPAGCYSPLTFSSNYNGSNYIDFGQFPESEIQPSDERTIGVWYRRLDVILPPASQTLIARQDTTGGFIGLPYGWTMFLTASGKLAFDLQDNNAANFIKDISVPIITNDLDWHFAVMTKSTLATELSLTMYFDGAPIAHAPSKGGTLAPFSYAGVNLRVGATSDGALPADLLYMCHSFIIDHEISAGEVSALYGAGPCPQDLSVIYPPTEVDHWCTLGDGCATGVGACPDLSALGNNGTAGGGMTNPDLQIADVPP